MKTRNFSWGGALGVVALVCCAFGARGAEMQDQGRGILEKHQQAVVTLKMVIKTKMSMMGMGEEEESKIETTGTVISPDGLTVLSLSAMDPNSIFSSMMGDMGDEFEIQTTTSDVDLLLHNGKELPAKVVLRDMDLDLAFVRPLEKPAADMPFIDLSDSGAPRVLDYVVALTRFGTVANRAYGAGFEQIAGVIEKPRLFYVPTSNPTHSDSGSPVFTLEGKPVGIIVLRTVKDTSGGGGFFDMMGGMDNMLPIILPCADIAEGAAQAPEAAEVADDAPDTETAPEVVDEDAAAV